MPTAPPQSLNKLVTIRNMSAPSNDDKHLPPASLRPHDAPLAGSESNAEENLSPDAPSASKLSRPTVGRLSLYYRELNRLHTSGKTHLNSTQLGSLVDVSPAVVRRDLSMLGTIGQRGIGYSITKVIEKIGLVMGSGVHWQVVLIGVGSLGNALLRYRGFEQLGFRLVAAFDQDPTKVGTAIGGVIVHDTELMAARLAELQPELAILAVPADQAATVAATLKSCGISGILNFAPTTLRLPGSCAVVNVDLASELQRLAFSVQHRT